MTTPHAAGLILVLCGASILVPGLIDAVRSHRHERNLSLGRLTPWQREWLDAAVGARSARSQVRRYRRLQHRLAGLWLALGAVVLVGIPFARWVAALNGYHLTGLVVAVVAVVLMCWGVSTDLRQWRAERGQVAR